MKKISSEKIRNERTERKCCFLFVSTIMLLVFSACTPASEKKEELSSRQKWEQSIRASYGEWTPVETQEETKFSAAGMYDEAGEIRRPQEMLPTPAEHSTLAQKLPSAVHTVVQGETLWGIAHKYYGKGWKWRQILEANPDRLKKGTIINPGLVLVIPHVTENRNNEVENKPEHSEAKTVPDKKKDNTGTNSVVNREDNKVVVSAAKPEKGTGSGKGNTQAEPAVGGKAAGKQTDSKEKKEY